MIWEIKIRPIWLNSIKSFTRVEPDEVVQVVGPNLQILSCAQLWLLCSDSYVCWCASLMIVHLAMAVAPFAIKETDHRFDSVIENFAHLKSGLPTHPYICTNTAPGYYYCYQRPALTIWYFPITVNIDNQLFWPYLCPTAQIACPRAVPPSISAIQWYLTLILGLPMPPMPISQRICPAEQVTPFLVTIISIVPAG